MTIHFQGKPIVCLSLPELRDAETNLVENIIIHHDKVMECEENAKLAKNDNTKQLNLFAIQVISSHIAQDEKALELVREQILARYNTAEFI